MERTVLRFLSTQNSYLETHYSFTYDSQNRLTKAVYGEYNSSNAWQSSALNRYSVNPIAYDDNGNITSLTRYGWISGTTYGDIDKLTYSYDGDYANQLTAISEISDLTRGFKKISSGADGYEYDNNGNLTADGYRGITYNYLNLPAKITYDATNYLEFTYDASGRKWKKTTMDRTTTTEKYYFGPIEYNGSTLEALYHEEGRAVPDANGGYDYEYAIRDHLGSTRVMFEMVNGVATLIEEHHNYPFGMELAGPTFVGGENLYRYTGKEWETDLDLGLYDFGARWYDPAAGRWWGVDALAESYYEHSPFTYVLNNPINFVDPDGNGVEQLTSTFVDRTGRVLEHRHDNDRRIYEVDDPSAWEAGGKTKDGLAVVGAENPNHTYLKGSTLDLNNRAHNALAPQSGALTPSYPIEELLLPLPLYLKYVGKWVYWGGKWVFVQTTRVGGKLFVRLVERGAAKTSTKLYSEATFKAFERQLAKDGMKSILKTQSTIQKNLAEHIQKLADIKKAGGYSSSVEREIKTFQSQLDAIKDLLK